MHLRTHIEVFIQKFKQGGKLHKEDFVTRATRMSRKDKVALS